VILTGVRNFKKIEIHRDNPYIINYSPSGIMNAIYYFNLSLKLTTVITYKLS